MLSLSVVTMETESLYISSPVFVTAQVVIRDQVRSEIDEITKTVQSVCWDTVYRVIDQKPST